MLRKIRMQELIAARDAIRRQIGGATIEVGLVLGTGFGRYAERLEEACWIPYEQIPHMPVGTVSGHHCNLVIGNRGERKVVAMQGRFHLYEGYSPAEVVFGVRLMGLLGATTLIVTNAAGGICKEFEAGDFMLIVDQINLTGRSALIGFHDERLGPRFVDMTQAFDTQLMEIADRVAARQGISLRRGVYACTLGPEYETPAQIRALRAMGADAVGMSTALEVAAARQMGIRVLGISCITNLAAGDAEAPLSHDEVERMGLQVDPFARALLSGILEAL